MAHAIVSQGGSALAERMRLIRMTRDTETDVTRPECPPFREGAKGNTRGRVCSPCLHPSGEGISFSV